MYSRFVLVTDEQIFSRNEAAVPNTKKATKFGLTIFKVLKLKVCKCCFVYNYYGSCIKTYKISLFSCHFCFAVICAKTIFASR